MESNTPTGSLPLTSSSSSSSVCQPFLPLSSSSSSGTSLLNRKEDETLGSSSSSLDYSSVHPTSAAVFNNDLILSNIFKFLPLYDLKNVRLVSHLWKDVSLYWFQKTAVVKLSQGYHDVRSTMEKFLTMYPDAAKVSFRNYKITLWSLDHGSDAMVDAFLEQFGAYVESLELSWVRFIGVDVVRNILFNSLPNLRRLIVKDCTFYESREVVMDGDVERLEFKSHTQKAPLDESVRVNRNLTYLRFRGGDRDTHPPFCWEEFFIAFPNVKDMQFYNLTPIETDIILQSAERRRQHNPQSLALQRLKIFNGAFATHEVPHHTMERLIQLNFPLNELSIDLGTQCNLPQTRAVLQRYRGVKKLIVYRGPLATPITGFPFELTFPNLRYFEMTETVADSISCVIAMPALESFNLCEPPEIEPPFLPSDIVSNTDSLSVQNYLPFKLTHLRIEYDISSSDVKKLVRYFPYVKRVNLYLDDEGLKKVCGEWPLLEELNVLGAKVSPAAITGIRESQIDGQKVLTRTSPNLLDLPWLTKYCMAYHNIPTLVDDFCVDEAFLKMKRLTHLEICSTNVTQKGWEKLYKCSHIKTLLPSDGKWHSELTVFKKSFYDKH